MKIKRFTARLLLIITCSFFTGCQCKHEFGNWETVKKPGYFETGTERRKCAICGEYETNTIPEKDKKPLGRLLSDSEVENKADRVLRSEILAYEKAHSTRKHSCRGRIQPGTEIHNYGDAYATVYYLVDYETSGLDIKTKYTCTSYIVSVYRWENNPDNCEETSIRENASFTTFAF